MKKNVYLLLVLLIIVFASCSKPIEQNSEDDNNVEIKDQGYDDESSIDSIVVTLDIDKCEATTSTENVNVKAEKDNTLTYIVTTIQANDGFKFSSNVRLVVNGEEVTKFDISNDYKRLEYSVKDPTWSPEVPASEE